MRKYVAKHVITVRFAFFCGRMSVGGGLNVEFVANGIHERPESVFDWCQQVLFVGAFIGQEYLYAAFVATYVQVGRHHDGVAVDVHDACTGAVYGEF